MRTESIHVWQVDGGDFLDIDDEAAEVVVVNDLGDVIELTLRSSDGDTFILEFGADDEVEYVTSFED